MSSDLQEIIALMIVVVVAAVASYRWLQARRRSHAACHGCYGASTCSGTDVKESVELIRINSKKS